MEGRWRGLRLKREIKIDAALDYFIMLKDDKVLEFTYS
jgi:hypothetical protein